MRVAVNQARKQRLPMSVIDVRLRIGLQERLRRANGCNRVTVHREGDVVEHRLACIDGDDRRMGKHRSHAEDLSRVRLGEHRLCVRPQAMWEGEHGTHQGKVQIGNTTNYKKFRHDLGLQ